ncbi:MAG: response regulator [Chloroflexi bacterium]|nr:response regulator [Chloroflexota bacterium]
MTDTVLNFVVDQMSSHQAILADFSSRLEPFANDLIDAWTKAFRETGTRVSLPDEILAQNGQDNFVRTLFGELKRGNLRQAFTGLVDWSNNLAHIGLRYDMAVQLVRDYQRAVLDFVVRTYTDDPQMSLVFDAFDDLFDSAITLTGAVYSNGSKTGGIKSMPAEVSEALWRDVNNQFVLAYLTEGMSHAVNNLLATILGRTQLLLERYRDFEIRDELEEIQSAAATGAQVMRRIQDYARVGANKRQIVDVNLLLRDASELTRFIWRDRSEAQGIIIDVIRDFAEVPSVWGNPSELRRVFVAVLLNAIEALPSGGSITLRTERKGDRVIASITDNGIGMRGDVKMNAAQSFFTTKDSPHLGLGLAIATHIIADHNGEIVIDSKLQNGTTVNISLPVAHESPQEKGDSNMLLSRPANVLVIDNESSVRNLLTRLIKMKGHTVVTADGGSEGIAAFKAGKFDAVLTDLGMPEVSGWDVAREIKKINPKVLVALTTGWPIEMTPEELKERFVDRIVSKPFDLPLLFSLIDEAVVLNEG